MSNEIRKKLDKGKSLILYEVPELKYVQTPIGKAHYDASDKKDDKQDDKKYTDRIECKICDRSYTRSNASKHRKTKHHQFCEKLNKKWRDMLIN
jgi:hypothetical protein